MSVLMEVVTFGVIDYAKAGGIGPVPVVSFSPRFFMVNAAVLYLSFAPTEEIKDELI